MSNSLPGIARRALAASISCGLLAVAWTASPLSAQDVKQTGAVQAAFVNPTGRYFVHYAEPSVATHNSQLRSIAARSSATGKAGDGAGTASADAGSATATASAIPYALKANGRRSLAANSSEARAYVSTLATAQAQHLAAIRQTLGHDVKVVRSFSYALNASVIEMSGEEAARVARLPGVVRVEAVRKERLSDDVSTKFIGASRVWTGLSAVQPGDATFSFPTLQSLFGVLQTPTGFKGDGIVVGDIDTGYNSQSPSFQGTDGSGYQFTNPLGSGKYLGDCAVPGISLGSCNDKVIGVYDKIHATNPKQLPFYSVEDYLGHGSHTASTAVGNPREADAGTFSTNISGIAPHANLVVYFVCENETSCWSDASAESAEQAIKDGVVDVLNFSIGGGSDPWGDSVSQAFLAAEANGIFVAAAAGNTGRSIPVPVPGSANHLEPWTLGVAATTDTGGTPVNLLSLTSPATPSGYGQYTQSVQAYPMSDAPIIAAALPGTTPYMVSPAFENADTSGKDGCVSFAANAFQNAVALISRGGCNFSVKAANAANAGAIAAVIADNRPENYPGLSAAGSPIPVFYVSQLAGYVQAVLLQNANGSGTVSVGLPTRSFQQPDVLANFSLWGPAPFDVLKPEISAPGVAVLAAVNNQVRNSDSTSSNYLQQLAPQGANAVDFYDGTSMATPHITGSAALLMGLHPDWTPMEVKSALMMTASEANLINANDSANPAPAGFFQRGSGRVQVDVASQAGLVLDESADNMQNADPSQGGDPSTLNLASMQKAACPLRCSFTRVLRSTLSKDTTWIANANGELGGQIAISPSRFTVPAGGKVTLTVTVDTTALPAQDGQFHFGEVALSQSTDLPPVFSTSPVLHMPVAVTVPAPKILASSGTVNIALGGKPTGSGSVTLSNPGAGTMMFSPMTSGMTQFAPIDQPPSLTNGYSSTHGKASGNNYMAQSFVIPADNTVLSTIGVDGFVNGGGQQLGDYGSSLGLHWRVYADQQGVPAGNPDTNDVAVWKYDATVSGTGIAIGGPYGGSFSLDLGAAGASASLPKGRYWLVVYPDLPCNADSSGNCTNVWNWFTSNQGNGTTPVGIQTGGSNAAWSVPSDLTFPGLAATINAQAACTALPGWLSMTPGTASVPSASSMPVNFVATAAGYAPQTSASALVCLNIGFQWNELTIPRGTLPIVVNASN